MNISMPNRVSLDEINARRLNTFKRLLRSLGATLALLLAAPGAAADDFQLNAGYDCKPDQSRLEIWFKGYGGKAAEVARHELPPNSFDPWNLVIFQKDLGGTYSIKRKRELATCAIGSAVYLIEVAPELAPGFDPEGKCASRVGARITVRLNGQRLVNEGWDGCTDLNQVTTRVVLKAGRVIDRRTVSADQFFSYE